MRKIFFYKKILSCLMEAITESITCPITGDVMSDPVQGNDGQTYEREAIVHALSIKSESPITRAYMTREHLQVNAAIRFLCDKYHAGQLGDILDPRAKTPPKISTDNIKLDHTITKNADNKTMLTYDVNKASMPELENEHLPQDLVLVLDRSGSTNKEVEARDADGNKLEDGMSILDIVIHASNTVVKTLPKNSRVAIVIFDNLVEIVFDLALMTEMNKSRAMAQITKCRPGGQTNIWGAVDKAIAILNVRDDKTRNGAIMTLTDGRPNIRPSRGEVETLKRLRKSLNFTSPIYTFGFGYNLERGLLYEMAKYGGGNNGHIPDGGMIATVFCHSVATILATVVVNLQLHIEYNEDFNYIDISPVMGDFAYSFDEKQSRIVVVDLGTVQIGQMRHIIMNTDHLKSNFSYFYTYKIGGRGFCSIVKQVDVSKLSVNETDVNINIGRFTVVEMIRQIINLKTVGDNDSANTLYNELEKYFTSRNMQDNLSVGILKNLCGRSVGEGQVKLAITNNAFYERWGEFYLDQLSRSLNQENKPNFRDPACPFGGEIFEKLVDKASDDFDTLIPPTPSHSKKSAAPGLGSSAPAPASAPAPTSLSGYNSQNTNTPCFTGNCLVAMADGSDRFIKDLKKGDYVCALSNPANRNNVLVFPRVVAILQTNIIGGVTDLVTLDNGLKITPWHPVLSSREWKFPSDINKSCKTFCDAVYTIVLDGYHTCMINKMWCITLGHGYTHGILKHDYYGTSQVINDLMKLPGWSEGRVIIDNNYIVRDSAGNVVKIREMGMESRQIAYEFYG